jgi:hypothetical protein
MTLVQEGFLCILLAKCPRLSTSSYRVIETSVLVDLNAFLHLSSHNPCLSQLFPIYLFLLHLVLHPHCPNLLSVFGILGVHLVR